MTNDLNGKISLDELSRLLDVYGGDPTRWPARDRLRMVSTLASSEEASRRLAEAKAFDQLLDLCAEPESGRVGALSDRILEEANRRSGGGNVVPLDAARKARRPKLLPSVAPRRPAASRSWTSLAGWPAAGMLAASLVLGILSGTSGLFEPALSTLGAAAGIEADVPQLALTTDAPGYSDEDVL